ncbi:hypothetical protein [Streptomyces pinistramenti]|uniref:hypothetical protein n=1 Tax=Streptomyces pinistramenti TaxID=2884812 RepID=UPI001D067160|nr:hypothetical protein [Streptomyces pinistramenti]MCB5912158.1 hypothetical protein [Streptomyces pinistramenti]
MAWRGAATTAAWVCAVATASGLGAWSLAHTGTGGAPLHTALLDESGVRQKLAAARSAAAVPHRPPDRAAASTPPDPTATAAGTVRVTGGSITAECRTGGRVYLTAWSPTAGYHVDDDVLRGPAATAAIEFEPLDDDGQDDRPYQVSCADGRLRAQPAPDDD